MALKEGVTDRTVERTPSTTATDSRDYSQTETHFEIEYDLD